MRTAPYRQAECRGCARMVRVQSDGNFAPHKVAVRRSAAEKECERSGQPSGLRDQRSPRQDFKPAAKTAAKRGGTR